MNRFLAIVVVLVFAAQFSCADDAAPASSANRIPLPSVTGRIDHLAVDLEGHRLFVAALGNNTVEVVDLVSGTRTQSIKGIEEPQGVAFLSESRTLVVASGGDGKCRFYDAELNLISTVSDLEDADNVRYDNGAKMVYVGYGNGALAAIDATSHQLVKSITLHGHPESFQLEPAGPRIFVNVPGAREVAVVDRTAGKQIASWTIDEARSNFPMALVTTERRLFIGCRNPAKLLTLNSDTGEVVASLDCAGDADDVFHDAALRRLYVIGGEGVVTVYDRDDSDRYRRTGTLRTAPGARTGLFVPEIHRLFVAAPARNGNLAGIHVIDTSNSNP